MTITDAFKAWTANPTPRTQAVLTEAMSEYGRLLDDAGIEPCWHEDLQVNCHGELVYILEMMGGAYGLIAA